MTTLIDDTRFQALLAQKADGFRDTRFGDCVRRFLEQLVREPAMRVLAAEHGARISVTSGLRSVPEGYAPPEPSVACRNLWGKVSELYRGPDVFAGVPERTLASVVAERVLPDIPRGRGPPPPVNPRDEPAGETLQQYVARRDACLKDLTRKEEHSWLTVVERDVATYVDVVGNRFTGLPWSYGGCFGTPLDAAVPVPYAVDDIYVKY